MITYWCRFFDGRGAVFAAEKLLARDDVSAAAQAKHLLTHPAEGVEIRDGDRIVARRLVCDE